MLPYFGVASGVTVGVAVGEGVGVAVIVGVGDGSVMATWLIHRL